MKNNSKGRKQSRIEEGSERQNDRSKRDAAAQLHHLDVLLGHGVGAKKERDKLSKKAAPES
jgi:hypothetical protein